MTVDHAVRLTLPVPPSVNSYWRSVTMRARTGGSVSRVLISAEGRKWKEKALQLALLQRVKRVEGEVEVRIDVYFRDRRRDLDNVAKPALDLLQAAGVLEDDRQVVRLEMVRRVDKGNPRVELYVAQWKEAAA